jgi:branched-chain amino acid transport system ATP-binding protein
VAETLLLVRDLVKSFDGVLATDHVSLDIEDGEIRALIGPNGAGKSTFIGQLMGELRPDRGSIRLGAAELGGLPTPQRVRRGLARTFQITELLAEWSVIDNVALAVQARRGHSFRFWADARKARDLRAEAAGWLAETPLAARAGVRVADLSYGEQKQVELVLALAMKPRLLLLDEPMAGLGPAESRDMIETLGRLKGKVTMLLVEHDMDAVFTLADRISVLVRGRLIATGGATAIRSDPLVRDAYLGAEEA